MKNRFLLALTATAATFLFATASHTAIAATDDGGFGSGTYFTAQTPDALGDAPTSNAFASGATNDADELSRIEPAAGGDNNVFTLPEDPSTPVVKATGDKLDAPTTPIVPGQTAGGTAN